MYSARSSLPVVLVIRRRVVSAFSRSRAINRTRAPMLASAVAVTSPSPEVDPVTAAARPRIERSPSGCQWKSRRRTS